MKKVIRLTESDLIKLVNKVIKEDVNEMYARGPRVALMDLMAHYNVHISPGGKIFRGNKMIGEIEKHMIPSGKYFVKDDTKRHLDLKDSFEEALRSILEKLETFG